jgi:diguanylate cyclase (GGDEF)-like protein/putative nucleotidyltransferase with HDIG domain
MGSPGVPRDELAMTRRILDAIEEYVYVGELLRDDGYALLYQGPCRGQFLALEGDEARAAVWADYVHPDDLDIFVAIHREAFETGLLDGQYRVVGADGVTRWVRDRGRVEREHGRAILYGSVLDVTAVREAQDALESARAEADRVGRLDPLTGTANRRALPDLLDRRLARGERDLGVLLLDLDRFKQINDAYGHAAGDAVLVETARRIRATVRAGDAVVRVGGEEFLILLAGMTRPEVLRRLGEAIRAAVAATPMDAGPALVPVTASVGAAISSPQLRAPAALLSAADRALYSAKRDGRDRVVLLDDLPAGADRETDSDELRIARAMTIAACAREGVDIEHAEAVARLSATVATRLGAPPAVVARCRLGGLLHDVGKLAVPDRVLLKPGRLDDQEWALMRGHPATGAQMVAQVPELRALAPAVRHHHERFDGHGYPDGLRADCIPLEARVIAAADAFSAMTGERPYRTARTVAEALAELRRCAGSQHDPVVIEVLDAVVRSSTPPPPRPQAPAGLSGGPRLI